MPTTLMQIKTWPNAAIVDEVHLRVTGAYEYKNGTGQYGAYTVQNVEAEDIAGEKIRLVLWDHPDATPLKGKDVVLTSRMGKGGKLAGVEVKHNSYKNRAGEEVQTVELKVTKQGTFQLIETHRAAQVPNTATEKGLGSPQTAGQGQAGSDMAKASSGQINRIHGATVGMSINLVCADLTARGESLDPKVVYKMASKLVKVALHMEAGNLAKDEPEAEDPF